MIMTPRGNERELQAQTPASAAKTVLVVEDDRASRSASR